MTQQANNFEKDMYYLDWPEEQAGGDNHFFRWFQPGSNICLDFHGDPVNAQLVVFSDGNHHMALKDCLDLFLRQNKGLSGIFYATTPPDPIVNMLRNGGLQMGNLLISVSPHVFISPPEVLDNLVADRFMSGHVPFVRNQGNVLLVKKGNPKHVFKVSDLMRGDVRLFLSNPDTEKASFTAYYNTLKTMASGQTANQGFLDDKIKQGQVLFGKRIHHREAPQALADDRADAAIVYYHLALHYIRIFPSLFEIVPLGGTALDPQPVAGNIISLTHLGLINGGGQWGASLLQFLSTSTASEIYTYHGLMPVK
ncbi:MAG: substrate-binding domain-containing protein [Proteobacteria bacterium]|nr:substrate-binding domain-containing protein [Pseudomonadota bacterium]